jgi:hypothetical protein
MRRQFDRHLLQRKIQATEPIRLSMDQLLLNSTHLAKEGAAMLKY